MAEVLRHIASLARRGRVIVQVLPFGAGAHKAMEGSLKLMDFEDAPPLVYFEGVCTGRLEDDPPMRNIPDYDLSMATWHKSSYSGGSGGDCLEVTPDFPALVPVRDSKNPHARKLVFRASVWSAFVNAVRS